MNYYDRYTRDIRRRAAIQALLSGLLLLAGIAFVVALACIEAWK